MYTVSCTWQLRSLARHAGLQVSLICFLLPLCCLLGRCLLRLLLGLLLVSFLMPRLLLLFYLLRLPLLLPLLLLLLLVGGLLGASLALALAALFPAATISSSALARSGKPLRPLLHPLRRHQRRKLLRSGNPHRAAAAAHKRR